MTITDLGVGRVIREVYKPWNIEDLEAIRERRKQLELDRWDLRLKEIAHVYARNIEDAISSRPTPDMSNIQTKIERFIYCAVLRASKEATQSRESPSS